MKNAHPVDLAHVLVSRLRRNRRVVSPRGIEEIIEALFFASLEAEEGRPIATRLFYIDPRSPDPSPPERLVADRWGFTRLAQPLPLDARTITKLALAADPSVSALAVFCRRERPIIWGLVDQAPRRASAFASLSTDEGPEMPGLFGVEILGPASLRVTADLSTAAELTRRTLRTKFIDAISSGPLSDVLRVHARRWLASIRPALPRGYSAVRPEWDDALTALWLESVQRLLNRVRTYAHGGALLIASSGNELRAKHRIRYTRLRGALTRLAKARVERVAASDETFQDYLDTNSDEMPVRLYLDEFVAGGYERDARSELDGSLAFLAALSRIDGLLWMDQDLNAHGFGVEITTKHRPKELWLARRAKADSNSLARLGYDTFGTRHRSMFRYISRHPDAVGFVVSQDGAVRGVLNADRRVIVWDDVHVSRSP